MANQIKPNPQEFPEIYSYGDNGQGAKTIFNERVKYDTVIFPDDLIPNFMETWNKDRFYGIVNTKGNTTVVDPSFLKGLRYGNSSLFALNFVADAWKDFCGRLRQMAENNELYKNSPWFNPVVTKAWTSVDNDYKDYLINLIYPAFNELYLAQNGRDKQVSDIDSFLHMFDKFIEDRLIRIGPITRSGFIESSYVSPLMSGLMIEMGSEEYSDDFTKGYDFRDQNFELVARIAAQYGFSIDKNIPWRLIADLRNPAMQEYMYGVPILEFLIDDIAVESCEPFYVDPEIPPEAYGYSQIPGMEDVRRHISFHFNEAGEAVPGYEAFQSVRGATQPQVFDILFSTAYTSTWNTDIDILIPNLVSYYNTYVAALPVVTLRDPYLYEEEACPGRTRSITRTQIDLEQFAGLYEDRWRLRTFYYLRQLERGHKTKKTTGIRDVQKIMNIYNLSGDNGYERALRYTQEEFIGPYDTDPLTLDTVGDIIAQKRRGEKRYAFPNPGRQD